MNGRSLIACVHGSPNNPFNKLQRDNSDLKSGLLAFPGFQFLKTLVLTATVANELRRWLDRNRMLLEMVFQAFLEARCNRKRTFNPLTTFT